jgi:hypothetical protein
MKDDIEQRECLNHYSTVNNNKNNDIQHRQLESMNIYDYRRTRSF